MGWADIARRALPAISTIGDIAAESEAGRTAGRAATANANLDRDETAIRRADAMQKNQLAAEQLGLQQREFGIDADKARLLQAIKLGALGGLQDVEINVPDEVKPYMAQISGGGRPSAIANRAAIVEAMQPRILRSLMEGEKFAPIKLADMPELTPTPKPGGLDKVLTGAGIAGTAIDALGESGLFDKLMSGGSKAGKAASAASAAAGAAPLFGAGGVTGLPASTIATGGGFAGGFGGGGGGAAAGAGGIGALGAATMGIGAAAALGAALWKKNRNDTKEAREDFVRKQYGVKDLGQFYSYLESLGPEGQELARVGRSVVGKKDSRGNAQWMQAVSKLVPPGSRAGFGAPPMPQAGG